MTAITRNLPPVVKDLGVSIVGKKCYESIVEDLNFHDVECLKYGLSKGLGLGIVVGGSVMKVPQLLLITKSGSADGLSLPSYILETLSYAITTLYSHASNFPFSTYGENLFLTFQNTLITLLIVAYSPTTSPSAVGATVLGMGATAAGLYSLPKEQLALLQIATLPLSLSSKLPQIIGNARAGSTGQLSAVAVIAQVFGCLARLFTSSQEVNDHVVTAGFALGLVLNLILGVQMWMYWGVDTQAKGKKAEKPRLVGVKEKGQDSIDTKSKVRESSPQIVSPGPRASTPTGRKWSRKVD